MRRVNPPSIGRWKGVQKESNQRDIGIGTKALCTARFPEINTAVLYSAPARRSRLTWGEQNGERN